MAGTISLLRPSDMLCLEFELVNLAVSEDGTHLARTNAAGDALIIVHFPPQALAEATFTGAPPDPPVRTALSGPSRLVFRPPPGDLHLTAAALLNWRDWQPVLAATALPRGTTPRPRHPPTGLRRGPGDFRRVPLAADSLPRRHQPVAHRSEDGTPQLLVRACGGVGVVRRSLYSLALGGWCGTCIAPAHLGNALPTTPCRNSGIRTPGIVGNVDYRVPRGRWAKAHFWPATCWRTRNPRSEVLNRADPAWPTVDEHERVRSRRVVERDYIYSQQDKIRIRIVRTLAQAASMALPR